VSVYASSRHATHAFQAKKSGLTRSERKKESPSKGMKMEGKQAAHCNSIVLQCSSNRVKGRRVCAYRNAAEQATSSYSRASGAAAAIANVVVVVVTSATSATSAAGVCAVTAAAAANNATTAAAGTAANIP